MYYDDGRLVTSAHFHGSISEALRMGSLVAAIPCPNLIEALTVIGQALPWISKFSFDSFDDSTFCNHFLYIVLGRRGVQKLEQHACGCGRRLGEWRTWSDRM
jgi:hypothetical protein